MPGSRKSHFQCQRDLRDFAKGETHFRVCGCASSGAFDSYSEEACSSHLAEDLRGNFKCIQFNMQMSLSASRDQAQFPAQHMWRPQTVCVSISGSVYMGVHINKHKWQAKKMSAKPCGRCRCCCCQRRSRCCCCCCHIFSRCSGWQRP